MLTPKNTVNIKERFIDLKKHTQIMKGNLPTACKVSLSGSFGHDSSLKYGFFHRYSISSATV